MNEWQHQETREIYWNHLLNVYFSGCKKSKMSTGFTKKRLESIKSQVMKDQSFWWDVIDRHGGVKDPVVLKLKCVQTYDHAFGNMVGMLHQYFVEKGIVK